LSRRFWAPGRVSLIGEFTDLAGGVALPAALDLGITLVAGPAQTIELYSRELDETVSLAADGSGDASGFGRYVSGVAFELALLGRPPVGLRGELTSTLPIGAGLSSSAALEIVVGIALCAVADFELEPLELALATQRAVHRAVGVPSGILDEVACLFSREGQAARMTGGGFGGAIVALVADGDAAVFAERMPARTWISAACNGARELT